MDSDSHIEGSVLESETLMGRCDSIWDVLEWGFYQGCEGWSDLISLIVRIVRNDWEGVNQGLKTLIFGGR